MLFFAGTRDPLCDVPTLRGVLGDLKAPVTLHVVVDGNHSFDLPRSAAATPESVYRRMVAQTPAWLAPLR